MCRQILRRIILNYIFVLCFQITSLNPSCSSVESDTYLFFTTFFILVVPRKLLEALSHGE